MDFSSLTVGELGLLVTLCGLVIVFAVLVILVVCISAFGSGMQIGQKKKSTEPDNSDSNKIAVPMNPAPTDDGGEIIAVIAAAVDALYDGTGKRAIVRSVKPADSRKRSAWATAGLEQNVRSF